MSRHHPSESTLLAHTAGSLPAPHRQVVALHLAVCPACAADARALEGAAGALLDALAPAALADDAVTRLLTRLDTPDHPASGKPAQARSVTPPTPIEALTRNGRWRWSGPGIALMPLMARDSTDTRLDLISVAPGTGLLEHGHTGLESTIVLQGAFHDGIERYETGDFAEAHGHTDHCPTALPGPDCICLIATSAHLCPRSLLGRLVRPLLGL